MESNDALRQDKPRIADVTGRSARILPLAAQTLLLAALWSATHRYESISGDAALYAVQAMAKIHPELTPDLFLQDVSQDRFTIFSSFYAWCIGYLGLRTAALALTVVFKIWFFAAAWTLARALTNRTAAFMAVALLIVAVGNYGAFAVFHYAEDWLTARSAAEALIVSALALHFSGFRGIGLAIGLLAMAVHPLMALPGVLLLACLWSSLRVGWASAVAGVLFCLGLTLVAAHVPPTTGLLTVIDPEWREIVHERSVFLFLQSWHWGDWTSNARPFLSLTLAAMALHDARVRKLCIASMLVAAAGLSLAYIAGTIGPMAVLMQGQAWRWEWVACFTSVLFLGPAAATMYRDPRGGPLCALLFLAGWTFNPINGTAAVALALVIWASREHIDKRVANYLRWLAVVMGVVMTGWTAADSWHLVFSSAPDFSLLSVTRNILGLHVPAALLAFLVARWILGTPSRITLACISLLLSGIAASFLPSALADTKHDGTPAEIAEFADWRNAIPPSSNVFVAPAHNSATFAWFILNRPSYLSVDQSAGVVFSRAVAMEVKRRSEVLLPMMPPDWRLLTGSRSTSTDGGHTPQSLALPLTADRLTDICRDPKLDFVVAKESVGVDAMQHAQRGDWEGWNLYDCRRVRPATPAT